MFSQKTTRRGDPCGRPPPERSHRPPAIAWALPNRGGGAATFQSPTGIGVRSIHVAMGAASSGAASSSAPSYDLELKKNRAAASSIPPSARPPRTARKRANGPTFPPKQKARTSSRRASSTPNARKRAPRMTPLQTSSDPEVADWEKPLGAACFTRRLGPASGAASGAASSSAPTGTGVLPGAGNGDVERRLSRGTMRPRRAPARGAPTVTRVWKFQREEPEDSR